MLGVVVGIGITVPKIIAPENATDAKHKRSCCVSLSFSSFAALQVSVPDLVLHCCVLHDFSERQECAGIPVARLKARLPAMKPNAVVGGGSSRRSVHGAMRFFPFTRSRSNFGQCLSRLAQQPQRVLPRPAQSTAWKLPFPDQCLTYFYGGRLTHCRCIRKRPDLRLLRVLVTRRGRDCIRV